MASKTFITFFLMFGISGAVAQKVAEDIRKINLSLLQGDQLAITLSYKVFPDSVTDRPMQTEEGKFIRKGKMQYQQLGKTETIRKAGDMQVLIDNENKIVLISNAPVTPGDDPATFMMGSLEALLAGCRKITHRNINRDLASYDLYPYASAFSRITVVYDKKMFYPKKMVLQHAEGVSVTVDEHDRMMAARIEIEFKSITAENVPSAQTDFARYITKKGSSYEVTAPYKEYQLNNYLLTN